MENYIDRHLQNIKIFKILLLDRSTNKNIVWATDNYLSQGILYSPECEIQIAQITGENADLIKPRVTKAKKEQNTRTRDKAEVFTPSWVCNLQNNLIDERWFERQNVFNKPTDNDKKWKTNLDKIEFPSKARHTWQDYIRAKRMEITCGEAPYLVSRYDTVTGKAITNVKNRIGLLDRKLRIVDENTETEKDWFVWVKKAYQSIYGYEYQGDNLLLARINLLNTFSDYLKDKFDREATEKELREIAYIISWNIWQMDGLTFTAPYSEKEAPMEEYHQFSFFDEPEKVLPDKIAIPCVIRDWTGKCYLEYQSMIKGV